MSCGALIRLACYRTMGRLFTWELALKKNHTLVTGGPYSVVRHPSYTGSFMIGLGLILCQLGPGSWFRECVGLHTWGGKLFAATWAAMSLGIPVGLMSRVNVEDEILRKEFNEEWEVYARKTPYKLFPYVY